jgi:hypothetical protein
LGEIEHLSFGRLDITVSASSERTRQRGWPHVRDEHVGIVEESKQHRVPGVLLEIENDRALVSVQIQRDVTAIPSQRRGAASVLCPGTLFVTIRSVVRPAVPAFRRHGEHLVAQW